MNGDGHISIHCSGSCSMTAIRGYELPSWHFSTFAMITSIKKSSRDCVTIFARSRIVSKMFSCRIFFLVLFHWPVARGINSYQYVRTLSPPPTLCPRHIEYPSFRAVKGLLFLPIRLENARSIYAKVMGHTTMSTTSIALTSRRTTSACLRQIILLLCSSIVLPVT